MKAIIHTRYGAPDELQLREVEKPIPGDDEVLVRIHASTVTSSDCNVRNLTFAPAWSRFLMRLFVFGAFKPRVNRLGMDLAGEVEAIGKGVTRFKVGDSVFGRPDPEFGAHAEYICIPENGVLTRKPSNMDWEEAACLSLAGNTALYFIRDLANVQSGQSVLVNGASGGIGTYAVQLAKHYGADVTSVCSSANVDLVRSLGVDRVIDYTKEDFSRSGAAYDIILDAVGRSSFSRCKNALKKQGLYLTTLPTVAIMLQAVWTSLIGEKKVKFGDAIGTADNLEFLRELAEAGEVKSVIDRCYSLEETAEAFRYVEEGHKKGNVVINVSHTASHPQDDSWNGEQI
jgi:NADPH:quinone reductase-like Zn-dependent oxidoreductase